MTTDTLKEAQGAAKMVLAGVSNDQLSTSSPCSEWDVAAVIDHLVGTNYWMLQAVSAATPGAGAQDASSGDYRARFDEVAGSLLTALSVDGFATREVALPFGTFTGDQFSDFVSLETLTHAWDLAKATSQDTDLAPDAAEHLLKVAQKMMSDDAREGNANFGAVQPCAPDAPAADRLAAFLGRSVD
jgi:uncharacterized protein (TIGR03086 family)